MDFERFKKMAADQGEEGFLVVGAGARGGYWWLPIDHFNMSQQHSLKGFYERSAYLVRHDGVVFLSIRRLDEHGDIYYKLARAVENQDDVPQVDQSLSSLDRAIQAVDAMSDADAIACLDPVADADAMQSALVLVASGQPAAADMLKVLAARGRQRCRDWEVALDSTSPHAGVDELLPLFVAGPDKAPSMAWLDQHIQKEAAA